MEPWPAQVFCDTSFFFACLEAGDAHHAEALAWLRSCDESGTALWATWEIISETLTLLRRKCGYRKAAEFARTVVGALRLAPCDDSVREEALLVFERFARDKDLSFCDCLSFVVLTSVVDPMPAATFDRHFKMLGLPVLAARAR